MAEAVVVSVNLFCHQLDRVFEFYRQLFTLDEIEEHRSPIYRALRFGDSGRAEESPAHVGKSDSMNCNGPLLKTLKYC